MANQWFKFYGQEFLSDMKISQLSIPERMLWVTILCLASSEDKDGLIEYCTEPLLKSKMGLYESDEEWKQLDGALNLFKKMGMLDLTKNGIFVKNFKKKQESYLTPSEKMSRYRAKNENKVTNVTQHKVTNVTSNRIEESRVDKNRIEKSINTFDLFWSLYPNKKSKKNALKFWAKINPDDKLIERIMTGLKKQTVSDQWVKDGGKFIPHPSTWLNQERWDDEISPNIKKVNVVKI